MNTAGRRTRDPQQWDPETGGSGADMHGTGHALCEPSLAAGCCEAEQAERQTPERAGASTRRCRAVQGRGVVARASSRAWCVDRAGRRVREWQASRSSRRGHSAGGNSIARGRASWAFAVAGPCRLAVVCEREGGGRPIYFRIDSYGQQIPAYGQKGVCLIGRKGVCFLCELRTSPFCGPI